LELIETSGHVPGHQSVLVRLPETGPVLLTIDAVARQNSFTPEREAGPMDMDVEMLRTSTRKLLALARREQVPLTIFGHDGEQWQTLKKVPDFYR
jgi:N-acyl homoserine lactone hydrolase